MYIYMVPIFIIKAGQMNMRKKSTLNIHSGDINDGGGIENLQGIIINFYLIKFPESSTGHLYMYMYKNE